MIRVGINGFGRTGRMLLRASLKENVQVVAINDAYLTVDYMVYLFKYEQSANEFKGKMEVIGNKFRIDEREIEIFREKEPCKIPWGLLNVDIVVETTSKFTSYEEASKHFQTGAKYVILTNITPGIPTFIMGINHRKFHPDMKIVSTSCSAVNCLTPLVKVINDNFRIENGFMTCVQALTRSQQITYGPDSLCSMQVQKDTCGSFSLEPILPEIENRLQGLIMNVPRTSIYIADLMVRLGRSVTYDEIIQKIKIACDNDLKGIMTWTDNIMECKRNNECPYSCIFDVKTGMALDKQFVKLIAWYGNEYAFALRTIEFIKHIAQILKQ